MAQGRIRRLVMRRRAKWAGLVFCVLVLGVYVASAWYEASWVIDKPNQSVHIAIGQGGLRFGVLDFDTARNYPHPRNEFHFGPLDNPSINLWPVWATQVTYLSPGPGAARASGAHVRAPLWLPLLLIATPTAYLWRTDWRAKPWQCAKCRYDLRGLEGEVCPECGESIVPRG